MRREELSKEIIAFFDSKTKDERTISFEEIWQIFLQTITDNCPYVVWQILVRAGKKLIYYYDFDGEYWLLVADSADKLRKSRIIFDRIYVEENGVCSRYYKPAFKEICGDYEPYKAPVNNRIGLGKFPILKLLDASPYSVNYPEPVVFVPSLKKYVPLSLLSERERTRRELIERGKDFGISVSE